VTIFLGLIAVSFSLFVLSVAVSSAGEKVASALTGERPVVVEHGDERAIHPFSTDG
jgi:hypothetical protein